MAGPGPRSRVWLLSLGIATLFVLGLIILAQVGAAPRELARRVERPADSPAFLRAGADWLGRSLRMLDGYPVQALSELPAWAGAQAVSAPPADEPPTRIVASVSELLDAVAHAQAGDVIELAEGEYRIALPRIVVEAAGRSEHPIVLRARRLGQARLVMQSLEGFLVRAPFWRFENLDIRGACPRADDCDHAFHIVGAAHSVRMRNNRITDFNAHIKINGERGVFPERGSIEFNTLSNTAARRTANPVVAIDLVAASGWVVRGNLIADFIKSGGDRISYGAFAKGGGSANRFETNVVICEAMLTGYGGQRVGLSFGGGGTAPNFCRDGLCVVEQQGSSMRNNLVARCSDRGIYLNGAADSLLSHNTVLNTSGVTVRHAESSARVEGNLIEGEVSARDGAIVHLSDNRLSPVLYAYFGWHPLRALYQAPDRMDFAWLGEAPRRESAADDPLELCPGGASDGTILGAFANYAVCKNRGQAATPVE